jgi:hypothetical protein
MTPFEPDHDPLLAQLLRAANPPLADSGFSERVMARVRRGDRMRHAVLALAAAAGLALGLLPASRLLLVCSEQVVVASLEWSDSVQQHLPR